MSCRASRPRCFGDACLGGHLPDASQQGACAMRSPRALAGAGVAQPRRCLAERLHAARRRLCACLQGNPRARLVLRDWLANLATNYHHLAHAAQAAKGHAALLNVPVRAAILKRSPLAAGGLQLSPGGCSPEAGSSGCCAGAALGASERSRAEELERVARCSRVWRWLCVVAGGRELCAGRGASVGPSPGLRAPAQVRGGEEMNGEGGERGGRR